MINFSHFKNVDEEALLAKGCRHAAWPMRKHIPALLQLTASGCWLPVASIREACPDRRRSVIGMVTVQLSASRALCLHRGRYVPLLGKVTVAMLERNLVRLFYNFHNNRTAS